MSFLSRIEFAARDPRHEDHNEARSYLEQRNARTKQRQRMGLDAGNGQGHFSMQGTTLVLDMLPANAPPTRRGDFS